MMSSARLACKGKSGSKSALDAARSGLDDCHVPLALDNIVMHVHAHAPPHGRSVSRPGTAASRAHPAAPGCACSTSGSLAAFVAPHRAAGQHASASARRHVTMATALKVDTTLNPLVANVKPSKTMALTDLATSMKEQGIDVSA